MKKNRFFLIALLFGALAFSFTACDKEDGDDDVDPSKGIIGEWHSSGANVAVLLQGEPFFTDSIYAKMNENGSYRVESYDGSGVLTLFTGTFMQEESGTGEIWTIALQQGVPYSGTSEGIFEIYWTEDPIRMKYEILQTEPALGLTPPTPEAGFGSTAGGILGTTNVQTFLRIN